MVGVIDTTEAASPGLADTIATWATDVMERLGAPGAGILIALENLFPPLPSEVVLPLAGFTASRGEMSLLAAVVWTTMGSLVGALVLYAIGALVGRERLRAIVARMPLLTLHDLDRSEAWFVKHGRKAVLLGRMVPIFRSLISVPAGLERMSLGVFVLFTTVGSLIWNTTFILAGYALGQNWRVVEEYVGMYSKGVLALVVAAAVGFVAVRLARWRRPTEETAEASGPRG
ncbi:membrane protein DedA with SNARE-associated domain [Thermasporomyces composti]|uniref:Membrane protein DedA with SNARE-associated domain n=1 Tax=Thermasporomyces composti TaxID=696763 RepID=A0A3D9UZU8_THECX|nr:membrane protein DedA with SNARE-associated domain [Thermasporomyces composti]